MRLGGAWWMQRAAFAAALWLACVATTVAPGAVDGALVWWPSGVAIAGLAMLGRRAVWVVFVAMFACRHWWAGNPLHFAAIGALGSAAEALVGDAVLRRFHVRPQLDRLRDTIALLATALLAPLASIVCSWCSRLIAGQVGTAPLYTGWRGWWHMNAIAIVVVLPAAVAWLQRDGRRPPGAALRPLAFALAMVAVVTAVMLLAEPGATGVLLLLVALPVAFFGALQLGSRCAATTAFATAVAIALPASHGVGVFEGIPYGERHVAAQLLLLTLTAIPLVFGALLAEREANAERWLRSEAFGSALLRILPDVTYRLRPDGTFVDVFVPAGQQKPTGSDALLGRRIQDVVEAELGRRLFAQLQRAHRGEVPDTVEYSLAGRKRRSECEMRFLRLPNGDVLALSRDITERKRAERQLAFQADVLRQIAAGAGRPRVFAALVEGIEGLLPDCRASILLANNGRLYVACAPSLPREYNVAIGGLPIGPGQGPCGSAAHENRTVVCEDLANDPHWAPARELLQRVELGACWAVPVRSADGAVAGTLALYYPTARRPDAAAIAFSERAATLIGLAIDRERREELLASIQRNVSEGLYRSLPGEGFVHVNASFARLFGYASADELQRQWRQAAHEAHRAGLEQLANETLTTRHREVLLHRRDGAAFWALVSSTITFHDDDAELLCDGSVVDVTERKQLEEQLRQAQKMEAVGQLAGGVAHDFNNLLTAVRGYAATVRDRLPAGSPERSDVEQILAAADRATGLTRQLLAFGRRQRLTPQVLDLGAVVADMSGMLQRLIGEHIELSHEAGPDSVRARVDRGQLEQVLLNLVLNARDAMPNGGRITVTTGAATFAAGAARPGTELPSGRYAVLSVCDTGAGMTAEVRMRAFDPFFTTKEPGKGTGLGLSTVYGIARQSGGMVVIDSEPGAGTAVRVFLPFAEELPAGAAPEPRRPAPARAGRVLVVEDEDLVRELAQRALRDAGHDVLAAKDGVAALEQFAVHGDAIDVVVADLMMPRMGGRELARRLRAQRPGLCIVHMTGYADDVDGGADVEPCSALLQKPFTAAELADAVGQCLDMATRTTDRAQGTAASDCANRP